MGALLVPVILVLIVLVAVYLGLRRFHRAEVAHSDRLQNADRPSVRYQVAPGQDVAAVIADLREAGYDVSPDSDPGPSTPIVIIATQNGTPPDREELRSLLDTSSVNVDPPTDGPVRRPPVRFLDE